MYSPKIPERLIPPLYRLAHARRQPMTRVVAEVLETYLASQGLAPEGGPDAGGRHNATPSTPPRVAASYDRGTAHRTSCAPSETPTAPGAARA